MGQLTDLGVDFGTANIIFYGRGRGIILNEPAVIAVDRETRHVLAIGEEARKMLGRAPGNIWVMRPLKDGMIADFDMASALLRYYVVKAVGKHLLGGPRVVLSLPAGVNEVERHSLTTALFEAGVRRTQIMERPIAAAIGAELRIGEAYGEMIVDIGGGMTDIAVLSLGRTVVRDSVKIAGDQFDESIIRYIRRKHNLLIGEVTAEDVKIHIGSAMPRSEQLYMEITGRNLITGLPKILRVTSDEITEAIDEPLQSLIENIHSVLEHTPAELAADIFDTGIVLSGGGANLSGLAEAVSIALKIGCRTADNAQECVARGCGMTLEKFNEFGKYLGTGKRR